jgi:transglutaminase-like putative cysteine protease
VPVLEVTMVDPVGVDWKRVERTSYMVHQQMHYSYSSPVEDLKHRLVLFPPRNHGDQRRVTYRLEVAPHQHQRSARKDPFGNLVVDLDVPRVEEGIRFDAYSLVERRTDGGPHRLRGEWLSDRRFLDPSPLTEPDERLCGAAMESITRTPDVVELAEEINAWVYAAMRYSPGVTNVGTTAAQALGLGQGVCQDYAHVMIALCRLRGLSARYVSGYLIGDGGMHAWVEVLMPCPERPGEGMALAFDPTHGRRANLAYVTVAVGRDYGDVSPTRGTFRAASGGTLSSRQEVTLTEVDYLADAGHLIDVAV